MLNSENQKTGKKSFIGSATGTKLHLQMTQMVKIIKPLHDFNLD